MTLTPVDIRNQRFKKTWRGYSESEVNRFLVTLAEEYEKLYRDNVELKENLKKKEFELSKYQKLEETLQQSIVLAQKAAEEVVADAHREAESIKENARRRIAEMFDVYEDILKRLGVFRVEIRSMLLSQVELLEQSGKRLDDIADFFYSRDMKEVLDKLSRAEEGK
ncbi:MAG TPA: DivIVA domain-containing protein [Syntrophothermus lipocalidus]|nr:DivIVA domain-containing protein [Syntrophothermus lipocalidus]